MQNPGAPAITPSYNTVAASTIVAGFAGSMSCTSSTKRTSAATLAPPHPLPAGCEDEARRFYGELLGLVEIEQPPLLAARGGRWFAVGDRQLHIGVEAEFVPARKAHPALRLADRTALGALAGRLVEAGVDVGWADPAKLPDASRFYVHDPWGNRLELIAYA